MLLAILLLLSSWAGQPLTERVDLIELNHFYGPNGQHAYDQFVFWEWSPDYCRMDVVAWKMYDETTIIAHPYLWHEVRWAIEKNRVMRVQARAWCETWSSIDPERQAKKLMADDFRRGLIRR